MQMLNRYFAPFAALLIASAIWFTVENPTDVAHWDNSYKLALGILAASILVNRWISKNTYRWAQWAKFLRQAQIWLTFVWTVPLFWLLQPFWAPTWLLFVLPPATAAMYTSKTETVVTALVSAGAMLGMYWLRGVFDGGPAGGMAVVHASFIVVLALFVNGLAQTALRMRDASLPRV